MENEKQINRQMERLYKAIKFVNPQIQYKADFARLVNESEQTINNWETRGIPFKKLVVICKDWQINPDWVVDFVGEMLTGNHVTIENPLPAETYIDEFSIPKYDEVGGSMGTGVLLKDQPGYITNMRVTSEWLNKNVPAHTGRQNLCIVTGFGDSMVGMFNPGDPLIIDTGITNCDHDGLYFFRVDGEGFIKRLQRIPRQGIRVISKNPDYESWTITADMDFEVFGKVLTVWESKKF